MRDLFKLIQGGLLCAAALLAFLGFAAEKPAAIEPMPALQASAFEGDSLPTAAAAKAVYDGRPQRAEAEVIRTDRPKTNCPSGNCPLAQIHQGVIHAQTQGAARVRLRLRFRR